MNESVCILLSLILLAINVYCVPPTVRQTNHGPVEGIEQTSSLGQKYYAFRGIPFAEAPITGKDPYTGEDVDRRFKVWFIEKIQFNFNHSTFRTHFLKAPEPLKQKWIDNLIVHDFANFCIPIIHLVEKPLNYSENCLFLNIYVPGSIVI